MIPILRTAIATHTTISMKATAPRRTGALRRRLAGAVTHDGRFRLWANGLAFSRKVMRTGVPGSSKASRMELMR